MWLGVFKYSRAVVHVGLVMHKSAPVGLDLERGGGSAKMRTYVSSPAPTKNPGMVICCNPSTRGQRQEDPQCSLTSLVS